jgi:hypothetical protein
MKKCIGFAIYNTKNKKFLSSSNPLKRVWKEKPDEFFTFKGCQCNIDGDRLKNCTPKEVFYYWEK